MNLDDMIDDYNYSEEFSDVVDVFKSLSSNEKNYICRGNKYENSKNLIYRKVYKSINGDNLGFIEIEQHNLKTKCYLAIAVKPEFRRHRLSEIMIENAIKELSKNERLERIIWGSENENKPSNNLAKKLNFKEYYSGNEHTEYEYLLNGASPTKYNNNLLYRITYKDEGIYNALKNAVTNKQWDKILCDDAITWLPKPKSYPKGTVSYFTQRGYDIFNDSTLQLMTTYLDPDFIKVKLYHMSSGYTYKGECQVMYKDKLPKYYTTLEDTSYDFNPYDYSFNHDEFDFMKESLIDTIVPNVTLYHASTTKMNMIKPQGLDFGNKLREPGWSTFCWNNIEFAKGWALFKIIWEKRKELRNIISKEDFEIEFDVRSYKPITVPDVAELVASKLIGEKAYIYTIKTPVNKVSLGNTTTIDEYTIRDKVKPIKTDTFILTKQILKDYLLVDSKENIIEYSTDFDNGKYNNNRGIIKSTLNNFDYAHADDRALFKNVQKDYKNGVIKIGDDIKHYFNESVINFNPNDFGFNK